MTLHMGWDWPADSPKPVARPLCAVYARCVLDISAAFDSPKFDVLVTLSKSVLGPYRRAQQGRAPPWPAPTKRALCFAHHSIAHMLRACSSTASSVCAAFRQFGEYVVGRCWGAAFAVVMLLCLLQPLQVA
jgi:hypothetical protein